eukprot:3166032-Heterocapsa_arctica.AAC.1
MFAAALAWARACPVFHLSVLTSCRSTSSVGMPAASRSAGAMLAAVARRRTWSMWAARACSRTARLSSSAETAGVPAGADSAGTGGSSGSCWASSSGACS